MKTMLTHFNVDSSDKYLGSTLRGDTDMAEWQFYDE